MNSINNGWPMICKKHPKYAAKRPPRADCWKCQHIWEETEKNTTKKKTKKPSKKGQNQALKVETKNGMLMISVGFETLAKMRQPMPPNMATDAPAFAKLVAEQLRRHKMEALVELFGDMFWYVDDELDDDNRYRPAF